MYTSGPFCYSTEKTLARLSGAFNSEASLIAALFLFNNFHRVEVLAEKMCLLWEMKDYDKESLAGARGHKCCSAVCFIFSTTYN